MGRYIAPSELPLNEDGSVFHLHLKKGQLADKVILVGDPARVNMVASFFDKGSIECDVQSREFHTITGKYNGQRVSCVSHGIGTDNIDIVLTELDALVNINFELFLANGMAESRVTVMTLIKQSCVLVTILCGWLVFREKGVGYRLLCAAIIIAGIVIATIGM